MPTDPTQNIDAPDDFLAMADAEDTEGHLGAAFPEPESEPDGLLARADDDGDDAKEGFRAAF